MYSEIPNRKRKIQKDEILRICSLKMSLCLYSLSITLSL